jgi:methionine sulfoxide reductase catalytic subunit
MLIKRKPSWELPESAAAPEDRFRNRRRLLKAMGVGSLMLAAPALLPRGGAMGETAAGDATDSLYPVPRNEAYTVDRPITSEMIVTTYNNYYEFGSHKQIWRLAQNFPIRPWTVVLDGMVEEEQTLDFDDLVRRMQLEERVYSLRCVEAWSIVVPWSGFPLKALVDLARPLGSAKYLRFESFEDPANAPGQRQFWYPWPYIEGLTIEEATHDLAFVVTGAYGKELPIQNGAPLRLAVPWKYGFKSSKGIVRITFTDERPLTFWEEVQGNEYGFWANVNPEVPHPRWSQAEEEDLTTREKIPTRLFNGYAEEVADLYQGLEDERLFM